MINLKAKMPVRIQIATRLRSVISIALGVLCFLVAASEPGFAQEDSAEDQWFAATVVLDDFKLNSLRRTGSLSIPLPAQYVNRVDAIVLKRPVYFKEEKATEFLDVERVFRSVSLNINEALLDQLDYQAIELRIYESDYDNIVLRYTGGKVSRDAKRSLTGDAKNDSPVVKLQLKTGKGISGRIRGVKEFQIDSIMGELKISLRDVSLVTVNEGQLSFSMLNGDTLSGTNDINELELLTRWGTEVIDMTDIGTITPQQPKLQQPFQNRMPMIGVPRNGFGQPQGTTTIYQPPYQSNN